MIPKETFHDTVKTALPHRLKTKLIEVNGFHSDSPYFAFLEELRLMNYSPLQSAKSLQMSYPIIKRVDETRH